MDRHQLAQLGRPLHSRAQRRFIHAGAPSIPLADMNALKPITPRSANDSKQCKFPGTSPPQSAKSVADRSAAKPTFSSKLAASHVGGCAFSGMSKHVPPPDASACEPALILPIRASGFVEVDVRINDPGENMQARPSHPPPAPRRSSLGPPTPQSDTHNPKVGALLTCGRDYRPAAKN